MKSPSQITTHLKSIGDPEIAKHSTRFFKTGKGEYGEGDKFFGIRVPVIRKLAKEYQGLSVDETTELLHSPYHEARQLAVLILVRKYAASKSPLEHRQIYQAYVKNIHHLNGWDLVDCSAYQIVGAYLSGRSREPLYKLARSSLLWERRVAIISTFHFIRKHDFMDTLSISEILLNDSEDLIHKATGWMLREVGNRDRETEESFLLQHYRIMPRTMLRYAIEKFPELLRKAYLNGTK